MINYIIVFRKKIKSNMGFSLIELMVVVAILAFITLGLITIFSGGVRSYISGNAQLEAQRNARQAMDRMVRELRHATRVDKNKSDSSHGRNVTVIIPTIDNEPAYEVTYSWSGTKHATLYREVSGVKTPLIDNVLNLNFDFSKGSRIKIFLEVDFDKDLNPDISLNTSVTFRNS